MTEYRVRVPVSGYVVVTVEAASSEDAREKARVHFVSDERADGLCIADDCEAKNFRIEVPS